MPNRIIQHPVPLILRKVLKERLSGELIVRGDSFVKNIYFIDGNLIFARTTVIQERLGEILFKIGKIDSSQFKHVLGLIEKQTQKIGEILIQNRILTQQEVTSALYYQMRTIIISTFLISQGEWDFHEKTPEIPDDSYFKIELPDIIVEGVERTDNISFFKNRFYHQSPKMLPITEHIKSFLSPERIQFYEELTNFNNVSSEKIYQ